MRTKYDIPGALPADSLMESTKKLANKDVVSIASASTKHIRLFKPTIDIRKFLHHVTRGNHEAVKAMLLKAIIDKDMSLFYNKSLVTDCSGRTFENISGFEYALWALDKHMWTTILDCVPENGKSIFNFLNGQYDNIKTKGVTYIFNGKTITESHFDFENIFINELQIHVGAITAAGVKNWNAIDKQGREGVRPAQMQVPMHVVDEYCSIVPFEPVPAFIIQPKSTRQFCNAVTKKYEDWFCVDSTNDSALYKGAGKEAIGQELGWVRNFAVRSDLAAMKVLFEVRTRDFDMLKLLLESPGCSMQPSPAV